MTQNSKMFWNNIRTGEAEYRDTPTEDEVSDYFPQVPAAMNLYRIHREMGLAHPEAMAAVLTATTSEQAK